MWKFGRKRVYDEKLKGEWSMHSVDDIVFLGDFNGQMGRHIDVFRSVFVMCMV